MVPSVIVDRFPYAKSHDATKPKEFSDEHFHHLQRIKAEGSISGSGKANLRSSVTYDTRNNGVLLGIDNHGDAVFKVRVFNSYTNEMTEK